MSRQQLIHHLSSVDSTNSWIKRNLQLCTPSHLLIVTADEQMAGRGRLGRQWIAPPKTNLTISYGLQIAAELAAHVPQILAIALVELLSKQGISARLKWPNDIQVDCKKIAGILSEKLGDTLIVGLGLNVKMTSEQLAQLDKAATSMAMESSAAWELKTIATTLTTLFEANLQRLEAGGFRPFLPLYRNLVSPAEKKLRFSDSQGTWEGEYIGVSDEGALLILLEDGSRKIFYSGDILEQALGESQCRDYP